MAISISRASTIMLSTIASVTASRCTSSARSVRRSAWRDAGSNSVPERRSTPRTAINTRSNISRRWRADRDGFRSPRGPMPAQIFQFMRWRSRTAEAYFGWPTHIAVAGTTATTTSMPICEADPWRLQYFERADCPRDVNIPTEDSDAWLWFPDHRWVYDKVAIALSQGLDAGPHGVPPPRFPVFSKPITNLKGMGIASRVLRSQAEYEASLTPGHMWMTLLDGRHVSSDVAIVEGEPRWWRHVTGEPGREGTFDYWTVHAAHDGGIEDYCGAWIRAHLKGYT